MEINNEDNKVKILAYYLPQYYPFPQNDMWWGTGFTEWTNVGKSKPLFKGHYQPKVPRDLGYYDMRLPENAEKQAELARSAGIFGFCYWHYWFGEGKELLEMPFNRALDTGKPDFPFCLGWAAESWYAKNWSPNGDIIATSKLLIEQKFFGEKDNEAHFYKYLNAFKDKRYITVNGRPFFLIYPVKNFPDIKMFMKQWDKLLRKEGVADGFYWVAFANNIDDFNIPDVKFDAYTLSNLGKSSYYNKGLSMKGYRFLERIIGKIRKRPIMIDYNEVIEKAWDKNCEREDFLPTLIPNWDHTARSGYNGSMFYNSTPKTWEKMCKKIISNTLEKENKIIMLKSWNEWGEGNYMEPDLKYGTQYIDILGKYAK
jgi:hypothetical protein